MNQVDASLLAFALTSGGLIGYLVARTVDAARALHPRKVVHLADAEQIRRLEAWKAKLDATATNLEERRKRLRALSEELVAIEESSPSVQVELCAHRTAGGRAFCEECRGPS